jgi:hypothetical protein
MLNATLYGDIYQRAYVTADLARAREEFRLNYEVSEFRIYNQFALSVLTPEGRAPMVQNLAFAWVGQTMIELIEPLVDVGRFYRDALPGPEQVMAPHHVSTRVIGSSEDWHAHRRLLGESRAIVLEGEIGEVVRFAFLDEREHIGVYLESAWHGPNGEGLPRRVPRHPGPNQALQELWSREGI